MIVLDASAALEILRRGPAEDTLVQRLFARDETLHAPHLIDLEIAQVLRRLVLSGQSTESAGAAALDVWRGFPVRRHGHETLMPRVWSLRATMTANDAAYVALAEALGAVLLTKDAKLARTPGHQVNVELI